MTMFSSAGNSGSLIRDLFVRGNQKEIMGKRNAFGELGGSAGIQDFGNGGAAFGGLPVFVASLLCVGTANF